MFNLESSIEDWRRKMMSQPGSIEEFKMDELVDHLYCHIEELERQGHSQEGAFDISIKEIGSPETLSEEFNKVKRFRIPLMSIAGGGSTYALNYLPASMGIALLLGLLIFVFSETGNDTSEFLELNLAESSFSMKWLGDSSQIDSNEEILLASILSQHHKPEAAAIHLNRNLSNGSIGQRILQLSLKIDSCTRQYQTELCAGGLLEEELIRLDSNNLTPYLFKFSFHANNHDFELAEEVLLAGLATDQTNDYYYEKFSFLKQQLSIIGFPDERLNWASEVYASTSLASIYNGIREHCMNQSALSNSWRSSCSSLGERLLEGRTLLSYVYGSSLTEKMDEFTSTNGIRVSVSAEKEFSYQQLMQSSNQYIEWWGDRTNFPNEFYENAIAFGEVQAILIAVELAIN